MEVAFWSSSIVFLFRDDFDFRTEVLFIVSDFDPESVVEAFDKASDRLLTSLLLSLFGFFFLSSCCRSEEVSVVLLFFLVTPSGLAEVSLEIESTSSRCRSHA